MVRRELLLGIMIATMMILLTGGHALAESGSIHDFFSPHGDQSLINNTALAGTGRSNTTAGTAANMTSNTTSNRTAGSNVTPEIYGTVTGRLAMNVSPGNKTTTVGLAGEAGELGILDTMTFTGNAVRASDAENIDIDFPYFRDGKVYGPVAGAGMARPGILPFGPVSLAFPSIRQSVATTLESESTSFVMSDRAEAMSYPHMLLRKTRLPALYFEF